MNMSLKHTMPALAAVLAVQGAYAMDAVAAKHIGQADAVEKVAARIKSGGVGLYGAIPIPSQSNLNPNEMKLLAQWILSGAPDK